MKITEEYLLTEINKLEHLTPINIVKRIQEITYFPLDRAINGYKKYSDRLEVINKFEEHILFSPQLAPVLRLDPQVCSSTKKEKKPSKGLKIGDFYNWWMLSFN